MIDQNKRLLTQFLMENTQQFGIYFPSFVLSQPVLYRPGTAEIMVVPDLYIQGRFGKSMVGRISDNEVPETLDAIALWECYEGVKENFGTDPELWNLSYDSSTKEAKAFLVDKSVAARLCLRGRSESNEE